MNDIDFSLIKPRQGSKYAAFEELCCQLARRVSNKSFIRLHGLGGDGGVECYFDSETGRVAWQAKFVFDVNSLIQKATLSLKQAKINHPQLKKYILCFPFDLTGPTSKTKRGNSGREKFEYWRDEQTKLAVQNGLDLIIEAWSAFEIRDLILEHDSSGGIREYFFGNIILDDSLFANHIDRAIATAGPRYTPDINIETDVIKWFSAFSRDDFWLPELEQKVKIFAGAVQDSNEWSSFRLPNNPNYEIPKWPGDTQNSTNSILSTFNAIIEQLLDSSTLGIDEFRSIESELSCSIDKLRLIETELSSDIEQRHGADTANSIGWRQFMAERMVMFPAANLDSIRNLITATESLIEWLRSPACSLAFRHTFVLKGEAGIGKTHSICDVAKRRQEFGLRSFVLYGHEFNKQPSPWSRVAESIGLAANMGAEQLLDCLNSAGEATGYPILICIDAINETKPRSYWKNYMATMSTSIRQRSFLRLCFVCRDTYLTSCLPHEYDAIRERHPGFGDNVRLACQQYFRHYKIQPPITPLLQPELSNPYYLRLACKTLNELGVDRVPLGWNGSSIIVKKFFEQKSIKFKDELESASKDTLTKCLELIAKEITETGIGPIPWSEACSAIESIVPDAGVAINWLIGEELLIEDFAGDSVLGSNSVIRFAFDRFGDFLIASEILKQIPDGALETSGDTSGFLEPLLEDNETIESNRGILTELSILISEQFPGVELTDLVDNAEIRDDLRRIVIQSLAHRTPSSLTDSTVALLYPTFQNSCPDFKVIDVILACSWQESVLDAKWLDRLLRSYTLAQRDAFWSPYLHGRFQKNSVVFNLISSAKELPIDEIEIEIAERWVIVLLWFTAAADRRVKDVATRSAIKILTKFTSIIPSVIERFIYNDDDEVRERMLLSCYGALLLELDLETIKQIALRLSQLYMDNPSEFSNALIRDHIRSVCELALEVSIDGLQVINPRFITIFTVSRDWPLELPDDDDLENWGKLVRFRPNELSSDFFKNSMNCLHPWFNEFSKESMGKWILQRVAREFSYIDSKCGDYDEFMLRKYGGGRGKPVWAERIAKKYLWIGLYQLASRLNDHHVERDLEPWGQGLPRNPMILLEQRKLDPTIPEKNNNASKNKQIWKFPVPCKLDRQLETSFDDWIEIEPPPHLEDLVQKICYRDHLFKPLVANLSYEGIEENQSKSSANHRRLWIHLQSYLVPSNDVNFAYESLHRKNFLGQWLPRGAEFHNGFVGEYPWSTAYDFSHYGRDENLGQIHLEPSWNKINCDWKYDTTVDLQGVRVPSKQFFDGNLRWNGNGGFNYSSGLLAFLDPSVSSDSDPALLVNLDYLDEFLNTNQMGLVWTMVGEIMVADFNNLDNGYQLPRYTFSQVGYRKSLKNCFGEFVKF